jgi:hypothetical protein
MDPLSALAISAAVVQFADVGFRLFRSARDAYKSQMAQSSLGVALTNTGNDLSRLAEDVKAKQKQGGAPEDVFVRLCDECQDANRELQEIFGKLRARGSGIALAVDSARVAFEEVVSTSKIKNIEVRLSNIREQMMIAILSLLL